MTQFVLSLFPGIGLLDMAFEEEGFCVVRGPDVLWGGDIKRFHPPAGKFDGVIGGPPCQAFSRLVHIVKAKGQESKENLIPEFERCLSEARPDWFLMENVVSAPEPAADAYVVNSYVLNNRHFGAEQNRERRFSFGRRWAGRQRHELRLDIGAHAVPLENPKWERAVVATSSKEGALAKSQTELRKGTTRGILPGQQPRRTIERCAELQGLPPGFLEHAPFTAAGKYLVIGNGVPLAMGRAVAKAVKRAIAQREAA